MKHSQSMGMLILSAALAAIGSTLFTSVQAAELESVTVFAAASSTNAIADIGRIFTAKNGIRTVTSFAASSTLAKQIANGAPANVFLSANPKWMDYLADSKTIVPESRFDLVGNRIVLIAAPDVGVNEVEITPGFPLADLLGDGKLVMGDPDHVPAGIYGKEALENLGVWPRVKGAVARAGNVRAALALVERGEAPYGVVYATDAAIAGKVKVVGVFPEDSHRPIVYPVALVSGKSTRAARKFLDFLRTEESSAVFEKYGFIVR